MRCRSCWPRSAASCWPAASPARPAASENIPLVSVPETQPAPLRRPRSGALLGGVCAGLAPRIGVDPLVLRIGFVVAAVAGGFGIALYVVCWALIPADPDAAAAEARFGRVLGRRESWQVAGGIALLLLAVLFLFREWGIWFGDAVVW